MVGDRRVDEEITNYRNRMDSFISSFITTPSQNLLKKKHIEFRKECLSRLMMSSTDIDLIWDLEKHIFFFYELIEYSYQSRSCRKL